MATRKLGDVAVGEIVKLNENGLPAEYLVVHQGRPSDIYDDSCNGTWLLRKFSADDKVKWNNTQVNKYESSNIHSWLNSTMLSRYDESIQNSIVQVKIPYRKGGGNGKDQTGANGLSCKIFLLGWYEVGWTSSDYNSVPNDGSKLDYFESGDSESAKTKRFSYLAGKETNPISWHLRSPSVGGIAPEYNTQGVCCVNWLGTFNGWNTDGALNPRPALVFPSTLSVSDDDYVLGNRPPDIPSAIIIPDTIRGGEDTSIIWSAATDPDGNLEGYIVERSYNGGSSWSQIYQGRTTSTTTTIPFGTETVMFRVCAYDTYGEKSGWRTSENRTVVNNRAPAAPPSISVPLSPAGGDKLTVTWTASSDVDGNLEGYELERQWDGSGAFTRIYKGAALSYQDSIPKGSHTSVIYRVRAYDSFAAYSSYTTSPSRTIDNNTAPVIACDLSGDLGEKSEGFTIPYTVSDAEQQEVTVTEKVGNLVRRTYKPTLCQQNTFEVTGEYFQKILNGAQTVQIVATDSAGKSSTLQLTFTKAVHRAVITLSEPLAVEKQITVAVLAITGKIPVDAECTVEMTNNGNDPEPVWEDATADVKAGRNHPFQNKTQTNGWAFNFRVTVERGESGEDGYITAVQGGFQ